tara:strand:+ start:1245 stop:2390 length:1146 start_codon:yes stop_codon:yes gene_type:complete
MEQKIANLVFWQVSPSIHQASLITRIDQLLEGVDVMCVFMGQVGSERLELGWSLPDYGETKLEFPKSKNELDKLYSSLDGDSIHIFSNVVNNSLIRYVYKKSVYDVNAKVGLLSEGFNGRGIKGLLRIFRRDLKDRFLLRNLDFVLAIGANAYEWYNLCGVPENNIYPFLYVVDTFDQVKVSEKHNDVEIIFVGRLCARKNIDTLIDALGSLDLKEWRLKIIGSGEDEESLQGLCESLNINHKVEFFGALKYSDVIDHVAMADFLVLPSLFDGWGAVVNEALSQGTPVLCSDDCGAKDLIVRGWSGDIFAAESKSDLAALLYSYIEDGPISPDRRVEIRKYYSCISAEEISQYFSKILNHIIDGNGTKKPRPPWVAKKELN